MQYICTQIQSALERGRDDNTSVSDVSIMVYYTIPFKNIVTDPVLYIEHLIEGINVVMENTQVPLKFRSFCIQELNARESQSGGRLEDFVYAKSKLPFAWAEKYHGMARIIIESVLNTADIAVVMTATSINDWSSSIGGSAWFGPAPKLGSFPLAWVAAGSMISRNVDPVQLFTHEIGHLFGADHNREAEELGGGEHNETSYGYLAQGKFRTSMVDHTLNEEWIPYFSSKDITYEEMSIGDDKNDNRKTILENRGPIQMGKYGPWKSPLKSPLINQEGICSAGEVKGLFKGSFKGQHFYF